MSSGTVTSKDSAVKRRVSSTATGRCLPSFFYSAACRGTGDPGHDGTWDVALGHDADWDEPPFTEAPELFKYESGAANSKLKGCRSQQYDCV